MDNPIKPKGGDGKNEGKARKKQLDQAGAGFSGAGRTGRPAGARLSDRAGVAPPWRPAMPGLRSDPQNVPRLITRSPGSTASAGTGSLPAPRS